MKPQDTREQQLRVQVIISQHPQKKTEFNEEPLSDHRKPERISSPLRFHSAVDLPSPPPSLSSIPSPPSFNSSFNSPSGQISFLHCSSTQTSSPFKSNSTSSNFPVHSSSLQNSNGQFHSSNKTKQHEEVTQLPSTETAMHSIQVTTEELTDILKKRERSKSPEKKQQTSTTNTNTKNKGQQKSKQKRNSQPFSEISHLVSHNSNTPSIQWHTSLRSG
jgi:hypothetical protein